MPVHRSRDASRVKTLLDRTHFDIEVRWRKRTKQRPGREQHTTPTIGETRLPGELLRQGYIEHFGQILCREMEAAVLRPARHDREGREIVDAAVGVDAAMVVNRVDEVA